jgi:hypothetical protein
MEPHPQNSQKTQAKAHRQATATHLKKGAQRLQKGMTRFVNHNATLATGVALGASALLAFGTWLRPRPSPRLLPRIRDAWPRRRRAFNLNGPTAAGALASAALIGVGLTMLLAPRFVAGVRMPKKSSRRSN